jgi:hypothetical protein
LSYAQPTGLYYAAGPARWAFFTPILAPLLLPGVWAVVRSRGAGPLLLLLGWAGVVYLFLAGAAYQNFRFPLAYLPPLAVLAAIGLQQVVGWLLRLRPLRLRRLALPAAAAALAFGPAAMAAAGVRTTQDLIARKDDSVAIIRWTEERVPANASVITFNLTHTFRRYSRLRTIELYGQNPTRLEALLASARPAFVLVDVPSLRRQWRSRSPGLAFRWLERRRGLRELGEKGGFTLFRIAPRAE